MKICIVSSYHLEVTAPYVKRLQELHEVDFYVPINNEDKHIFLFDFDATKYNKTGFLDQKESREAIGGHADYFSGLHKILFFLYPNAGFSSPSLYRSFFQLAMHIRKQRYDVIHVIGQFPLLLLIHVLNPGAVRVHTLHESVPHNGAFSWYEKTFLRAVARMNIQLIFPSAATMTRFIEFTGCSKEKCHKIYFGIVENYLGYVNPSIREIKNQVLLFGFINAYKGVDYLAEAVEKLKNRIPGIHAVIAGRWSLPELREQLMADPQFTIVDKTLSIEEMTTYIQQSEAVICPYTSASNSGVIMTAFVFNKPVIASRIDGLAEVVQDKVNGVLVEPANSESLAAGIEWLLTHEEEKKKLASSIEDFKNHSHFSWDEITKETIAVYRLKR